MASDGLYVNNGVENVISITSSGSSFKGKVVMTSGTVSGTSVIDGGCISTNSIDANKIKSKSITADQIATGTITADKIATGTITANQIKAGAITSNAIAADAINGKTIKGGSITGTSIDNGNGTFSVSSSGTLKATSADIKGKITATSGSFSGSISGSTISGGTITGSKIIGQGDGNRVLINNADYEIQDGTTTKGFFGLRTLDDGFDTARLALSSTGLNKKSDNYFVIVPYNGNGYNPQSYQLPYVDIAYRCPQYVDSRVGYGDCSNIKMYADGIMRISPIQKLQITTNFSDGAYASSGERHIAEFGSAKHDHYNLYLDVRAIRNYQNNNGLVFSYKRTDGITNEFNARMMVYNDGFRTFAPMKYTSDNVPHYLGSGSYRWQTLYSVNSLNTSSDITLKENIKYLSETPNTKAARNTELSTQDLYEFVRDDLFLTSYNWKEDKEKDEKLGFIAQDIVNTKVGEKVIVCNRDRDDTLGYDNGNFEAVLAGALQVAIKKIEELEAKIQELENK